MEDGMVIADFDGKRVAIFLCTVFLFSAALFLGGCKKSDSNPLTNSATTVTEDAADAADAVSDALASNNGGAMDQVNDVFEIAGGVGVGGGVLGKTSASASLSGATYDPATMSWTMTLVKKDSLLLPLYYGYWTRNYWFQFRANGQPQKYGNTNSVLADTIEHRLLGGTGYFFTPRLVHHLISISSDWTASSIKTDTVTINGTYSWTGTDTIKVLARKGTVLVRTITLNFQNVRGPKGPRRAQSDATSGTISGTYDATVTTASGVQHHITRTFIIVLGGGKAKFSIDEFSFVSDLGTGDH